MDFKSNGQAQNKASSAMGSRTNSKGVERKGKTTFAKRLQISIERDMTIEEILLYLFLNLKAFLFDDIIQKADNCFYINQNLETSTYEYMTLSYIGAFLCRYLIHLSVK